MKEKLPTQIAEKIAEADAVGCWTWIGNKNFYGYGQIIRPGTGGRRQMAHRLVYELLVGPIADGLQIDHLCRNRACVNPAHLEPVTCKVNLLRGNGPTGTKARQTHCISGHEFTEANTHIKKNGCRFCRTCHRLAMQKRRELSK